MQKEANMQNPQLWRHSIPILYSLEQSLCNTVAGSLRALEHSLLCETLTAEAAYQLGHHYIHQDMFKMIEWWS